MVCRQKTSAEGKVRDRLKASLLLLLLLLLFPSSFHPLPPPPAAACPSSSSFLVCVLLLLLLLALSFLRCKQVDLLICYKRRRRGQPNKGVGWRVVGLTRFWGFSAMWIMSITHTQSRLSERNKNCLESGKLLSACTFYSSSTSFSFYNQIIKPKLLAANHICTRALRCFSPPLTINWHKVKILIYYKIS